MIQTKRDNTGAIVKNIEFDIATNSDYAREQANSIGFKPIFSYNGTPIQPHQISYCSVTSKAFAPEIELYFFDETKMMHNETFPLDNMILSMLIRSGDDKLRPLRIDFKIMQFSYNDNTDQFYIRGLINIDSLFIQPFKSYSGMSSYQVMDAWTQAANIGFASNIPSTTDTMTWINPGIPNILFLQDTITKAYKDDSSFLWGYIDFYYMLNYIDVENQLRNDDDNPGIVTLDRTGSTTETNKTGVTNLLLTNEKALAKIGYDFTFSNYRVFNDSTQISINQGYKQQIIYYDRSGNWSNKAGMFLDHDLNSLIKPNSAKNSIILKDIPGSVSGFFKNNVKPIFAGVLDIDNTHLNYIYAKHQNRYNLEEIQKVYLEIDMNQPNFNIYKFENIDIGILDPDTGVKDDVVNRRLTGRWLVTSIDFYYHGKQDRFIQTITLIKRELGA
jgi:hypothetical protein